MITAEQLSLVGKVNKTHGVDGELSVSFFDEAVMEVIEPDTCLIFDIDGIYVPFFADTVRSRSSETLLISLDGENKRESVADFVGKSVYMLKTDIPESIEDENGGLYAGQLIGYEAVDTEGNLIGIIDDIDDHEDNPLFVIKQAEGTAKVYVPIVDDFITDIDTDKHRIELDLPDGLLEINE